MYWSSIFIALMWIVFLLEMLVGANWSLLGIYPREWIGLRGVLLAPLLHGDWAHLLSNTPPMFALMAMLYFFYPRIASSVFLTLYLLTGMAVWAFGRDVFHIGASGVVYALAAYLSWNGIVRRNIKAIAVALVVLFYYGGMIVGILPGQEGISWESHLLGMVAGVLTAYLFRHRIEDDERRRPTSWESEEPTEFFERDVFEKKKWERIKEREARWR